MQKSACELETNISGSQALLEPPEETNYTGSSLKELDANELLTETMVEEEMHLKEAAEREVKELRKKAEKEFEVAVEKQRYHRLKYLLDRTEIYSTFLADKLKSHSELQIKQDVDEKTSPDKNLPMKRRNMTTEPSIKKNRPEEDSLDEYITTNVSERQKEDRRGEEKRYKNPMILFL
jgi:hypothetical protein